MPRRHTFHLFAACALISLAFSVRGDDEESAASLSLAQARQDALQHIDLRVEDKGWGDAASADVSAVLHSSISELAVHFEPTQLSSLEPIRVSHDESGPITLYQRTLRGEIAVMLDSKDRKWSQLAYQMAHEFGHIICRTKKGDRSNLWFEESLCELASIFALRQMAQSWQLKPPYPNWKSYSSALDDYADDLIEKHTLPADVSLSSWYQSQAGKLRKDPTQRELNGKVAVRLLEWFERDPGNWQAVYYLNAGLDAKDQSFAEYLEAWHRNSPEQHQPFVAELASEFGVPLNDSAKGVPSDSRDR